MNMHQSAIAHCISMGLDPIEMGLLPSDRKRGAPTCKPFMVKMKCTKCLNIFKVKSSNLSAKCRCGSTHMERLK